jgi:hypothetical protein
MNKPPMTGASVRYRIESVKGQFFDVFAKKANAIKAAIAMAVEYPGTTFLVVKTSMLKKKVIFRFKIETEFQFDDIQDVYDGVIEAFQKKLNKTKYWRKPDVT